MWKIREVWKSNASSLSDRRDIPLRPSSNELAFTSLAFGRLLSKRAGGGSGGLIRNFRCACNFSNAKK
jgi:hypothetical protein